MRLESKKKSGFTLIELMITISVFSLVMMSAVDVMVTVFRAQAKATAVKDVLDNARFPLELMTRELRTGTDFEFPAAPLGCPSGGLYLVSHNQGSSQARYYYRKDMGGYYAIMRVAPASLFINCPADEQQFTAEEVDIDQVSVILHGKILGSTDGQPRITISMTLHSRDARYGSDTKMTLQTTIAQRFRDVP